MTSQEQANQVLDFWQSQRRLAPRDRRLSADIGNMSYGLRDNAKDLIDIWMQKPQRRVEFGEREIRDIEEAILGLVTLLMEMERQKDG